MTTQSGGNNTQTQAEVHLKYVSEGYQKRVKELQDLALLIDKIKADLGSVTMPAIKGLKGALRDAGELSQAIQTLTRQGTVAGVTPVGKKASEEQKKAYQEAKSRQVSDTAVRQAQLDTQDRTLKLQRQLAAETAKELQQRAFQGKLTKKEIEAQKVNVENLKAIAKGYKEASDSGIKPQVLLQRKVNNLIEADITARKQAQQKQRAAETQTRLEKNKVALKFARQSLEGKNTGLAAYLKTADLNQVKAIESAMKAQSLKAGYTPTAHSQKLTEMVAARRSDLTGVSKQVIDPKSILQSIQSAKHKGETDYIIKQLRAELNRQTKVGASRDSLVGLHGLLADARSEAVKKFAPVSPFQEAKKAEEAHAKSLTKLNENQLKQQNNRLLLEEHLQASKIRSHKTNMTIGSAEWKAEQSYQDLLKQRISAIKAAETEQKRKDKNPVGTQLAEAAKATRDANVDNIIKNRQTAADKAAQRALDNEAKTRAITEGRFKTEQQIADLKQHELKFAKDTLNFGIQTGKLRGQERLDAEKYLGIIKQREAHEAKISQHNQNIRNLSLTHYKTENDLKGLKRAELEIAQKVIAYRIRNGQLTKEEAIAQQELYNAAKRRDHLLTAQAHRQDKERQNERRLNQLTHLEGDGGASMAIVQAGFMMRSQVLGGLSSIFSGAFESAIQLDKAFRNLQAISAATNYEMATMKVNLINVAQASKFSAAEVGETAVMLAQAGLSIQEIGASMKGIITLAQATGTDLAKSVDVVTSVLSIFNKSATETDTIVNQLTAALNESKLDINKMALGLQYAGNIANDSGVSFEELTAALGATANAGIRSGSTLGTGLRQMFIDLQKPNEKLTKRLETLGITLDQVNFRSQGLEGVLRNLRNAGFSSADAFETFEVRSAAAFSALSGNLTDFHDLQEELLDTNAAFEANNVQMESFAVQIDHLKSNLGVLAADGLGPVLSLLRDMTKGMAHVMQNAEEGTGVINVLTTAFVSLMAGATIAWFARLVGGIITTTAALTGLGAALSFTRYGWIGLIAAGATFIASIVSQRNEVERLNTVLDQTRGKYNDLKASLQSKESALSNVDDALKNLVDRYGVLKNDSSQTQAVTKSLQEQFNQFGLELDDVADNKIDNVINKVRDLRTELAKDLRQTIIEEAAAKIKLKNEEKLTAEASLRDSPTFGRRTVFTQAASTDEIQSLLKNPEIHALYSKYLQGAIRTQSEGKILPTKDFNPDQTLLELRNKIAELRNATESRTLTALVDVLVEDYKNITTVINTPEKVRKINEKTNRDVRAIDLEQNFNDPKAMGGASEAQIAALNAEINTIGGIKGLSAKEKRKRQSAAAKPVLEWFEKNIASSEAYIASLPNELDREIYTNLMAEVFARQGEVRKYVEENEKEQRKQLLESLQIQLTTAKEDLKLAEKLQADATGTNLHTKRRQETQKKLKAVQDIERKIFNLKQKDNPNSSESLKALEQGFKIQGDEAARTSNKQVEAIKDRAAKNEVANDVKEEKAKLAAEKRIQDQFFKDIENKDKYLKVQQDAERRQAKARAYIPLTSGNMFDQLSADEKKAAQAKANATGVAQEYSVFGKTSNPFARQAARFDNSNLEKRLVQQQLAREVTSLSAFQEKKSAIDPQKLLELRAKNDVLDKEVKRLRDIAENSQLEFDKKELANAEEQLELNKERILAAEDYELRLSQAIEERTNNVNALKDTLQALTDKYNTLDTTLSAGIQSMTSGLSSIFSDWASGVIQNTEDVRDAFESLGRSILQSMAKVVSDKIAEQFMGFLLNGLGNMFGGSGEINLGMDAPKQITVSTGGLITTSGVKHFARGGEVTGTNIGRDSVPALLQPNEYVVQRSAVQALGTDFMQNLNNVTAGSLKQGAANLGGSKPMVQNVMKSSPPVNVYVVSPEQQRQMGQEDVVVALQDDILRGGTTKKLIKAVITGEI